MASGLAAHSWLLLVLLSWSKERLVALAGGAPRGETFKAAPLTPNPNPNPNPNPHPPGAAELGLDRRSRLRALAGP
eukprot:scaffold33510_cov51-Phaeocystis_antarctica.AAC.2